MDLTKILKVGDKVYSPLGGYGTVLTMDHAVSLPLKIQWRMGNWSSFTKEGKYFIDSPECLLFPSKENRDWSTYETEKECPFKPFEKVLVRDDDSLEWACGHFSYLCDKYCVSGLYWNQCIPYNKETKHLVGTNQDCSDKYKIW